MMEETKRKGKRKQGQDDEHQEGLSGINHPGINDVMFGRGGDTNYHIGNNSFRHLVESYQDRYWAATNRKDKSQMIAAIIHTWRTQKPAGRFLTKTDPTKGDDSLWHDVGDQIAGRKASKILSEMRIGKKKAEGKKRKTESKDASESSKRTKETQFQFQGHFHELRASDVPLPVPSNPNSSRWDNFAIPGAPVLATNESLSGFDAMQDLLGGRIQASNPLVGQQGINDVFNWDASPFFRQQQHQHQHEQQTETKEPAEDAKIADSVPVAAMLTDVFHDQYISNQAVAARKDSSSTDEEN